VHESFSLLTLTCLAPAERPPLLLSRRYPITAMNYRGKSVFKLGLTVIDVPPELVGYTTSPVEYVPCEWPPRPYCCAHALAHAHPALFKCRMPQTCSYAVGTRIPRNTPVLKGGAVVAFSGALPQGLTLNQATGVISGSPTAITAPKGYRIRAVNSGGKTEFDLIIGISDVAPQVPTNLACCARSACDFLN